MRNTFKKMLTALLTLSMTVSMLAVPTFAAEAGDSAGSKTAKLVKGTKNSYTVEVQVPGGEADKRYDEVIVMVDGSYSMDSEWTSMKQALVAIGNTVLNGNGNTKLSILTFGMSWNVVTEHVESVSELEESLPALPGGLLYGRSSTNCEGAFLGLADYIDEIRDEAGDNLNDIYVLFLSDGGVNMWSAPIDWNNNYKKIGTEYAAFAHTYDMEGIIYGGLKKTPESIKVFGDDLDLMLDYYETSIDGLMDYINAGGTAKSVNSAAKRNSVVSQLQNQKNTAESNLATAQAAKETAEAELDALMAALPEGAELTDEIIAKQAEISTLTSTYNTRVSTLATINAKLDGASVYDEYSDKYEVIQRTPTEDDPSVTKAQRYVHLVWENFYKATDITHDALPIHTMETAFLKYQDSLKNKYIENCFYYVAASFSTSGGDSGNAAAASAAASALLPDVTHLYMVRYGNDRRSNWMTNIEGTTFVQSSKVSTLVSALADTLTELASTPYNDVVVTDYMSKWVNLDAESIEIVDKATDEVIWNTAEGWLIDEGIPTAAEPPVAIDLVDPADYALGGEDVEGNENGDIYKLTWTVKDGALLRSDSYALRYTVTVDSGETGFRYNKNYPANGTTRADYTDENGEAASYDIKVPNVKIKKVEPKAYSLTVNYLDKESGESISASYTTSMEEGSSYDVTDKNAIAIDGYTWDSTDAALTGTLTGNVVINVYYVADEVIVEIPEEETPKAEEPEIDEPVVDEPETEEPSVEEPEIEEIPDEDVPLVDVPKTGDTSLIWILAAAISAAGMFFLNSSDKRRNEI